MAGLVLGAGAASGASFGLPKVGGISYGGWNFSAICETTDILIVPIMDEAGRTVIYNRYTITIRDYIYARSTDSLCTYARQILTKNGQIFNYQNRGLGFISINSGAVKDVEYGPKCKSLSLRPVGGKQVTELVWTVEICMPDCPTAKYSFALMEFNYRLEFSIDDDGLTTRTYSGFLKIPETRNGPTDRTLSDTVDYYRETIVPPLLPQFRRNPGKFQISYDKRRLDFSIVDTEFFGPAPPPGVTVCSASHRISSGEIGLVKWTGSLAATYRVAVGYSKSVAVQHFLDLAKDRIGFSAQALGKSPNSFVLLTFSANEPDLYGSNNAGFSLTYSFVTTLDSLISSSGLWREVPNSNWGLWASSMKSVLGPRGIAGLQFTTGEDRIIDLCDRSPQAIPGAGRQRVEGGQSVIDIFAGGIPSPNESWITYECNLQVEADDGVTASRALPKSPLTNTTQLVSTGQTGTNGLPILPQAVGDPPATTNVGLWPNVFKNTASNIQMILQQRTTPMVVVYLVGKAARVGYPIPIPELVPNGQFKPVKANRLDYGEGFTMGIKYNVGNPVYVATWKMRYFVAKHQVDQIPIPKTPIAAKQSR